MVMYDGGSAHIIKDQDQKSSWFGAEALDRY